jgi:hypothetical protein
MKKKMIQSFPTPFTHTTTIYQYNVTLVETASLPGISPKIGDPTTIGMEHESAVTSRAVWVSEPMVVVKDHLTENTLVLLSTKKTCCPSGSPFR